MRAATEIQNLHDKFRRANELENEPIPGFTEDELEQLQSACKHPLSTELRAVLRTAGVFAFAAEIYFEDVGYFCLVPPATMIENAANLRNAADKYGWDLPPCCSLSLVNNEFIAYDFDKETVISVSGDDGEVNDLGLDLDSLYANYAELWSAELES